MPQEGGQPAAQLELSGICGTGGSGHGSGRRGGCEHRWGCGRRHGCAQALDALRCSASSCGGCPDARGGRHEKQQIQLTATGKARKHPPGAPGGRLRCSSRGWPLPSSGGSTAAVSCPPYTQPVSSPVAARSICRRLQHQGTSKSGQDGRSQKLQHLGRTVHCWRSQVSFHLPACLPGKLLAGCLDSLPVPALPLWLASSQPDSPPAPPRGSCHPPLGIVAKEEVMRALPYGSPSLAQRVWHLAPQQRQLSRQPSRSRRAANRR